MSERRQEIAIGIVVANDEVLLVERAKQETGQSGATLSWVFPGGKLESGETPEQAATREVLEESGYSTVAFERVAENTHPQFPVYVYYIACELQRTKERTFTSDAAIRSCIFVPKIEVMDYVTSQINPYVAKFLGIEL